MNEKTAHFEERKTPNDYSVEYSKGVYVRSFVLIKTAFQMQDEIVKIDFKRIWYILKQGEIK